MVIFLLISLIPLGYTIAWIVTRKVTNNNGGSATGNLGPNENIVQEANQQNLHCRKKILIVTLQIVILIIM
jgi:hypothetical protein